MLWLRRDLRRLDQPALAAAAAAGPVTVLYVVDPVEHGALGPVRRGWLAATVRTLAESYDGHLTVRLGDPALVVPAVAREVGASSVHVSTETEPYGSTRDRSVRAALDSAGVAWVETGSPYAVTPGRVRTKQGTPYSVFTPFSRAWREHGWRAPATEPAGLVLADTPSDERAWQRLDVGLQEPDLPPLPPAGEQAALDRWHEFLDAGLATYATDRDRADLDGTSGLSPYLAVGAIHPRTLLADLAAHEGEPGAERFITELAWREFYADVLHHHPESAWTDLRPVSLSYDQPADLIRAWDEGRTGYPFVDAGMRQLLATGWMHNRVRMVVASFLTKDLHVWWPSGARHFLNRLVDGDLASNSHGWQWVAGTGTDPAIYTRVFNPVLQGRRYDPRGDYVRRWIPELRHIGGPDVHEPWLVAGAHEHGYPARIVDHAEERRIALARWRGSS